MNIGFFEGKIYRKNVVFSKAVLWHTKELSLREDVMNKIRRDGIEKLVFVDELKGEQWVFSFKKVEANMRLKQFGQEKQYYFPIALAKKEKLLVKKKKVYDFDEARQTYVEKTISYIPDDEKSDSIQTTLL